MADADGLPVIPEQDMADIDLKVEAFRRSLINLYQRAHIQGQIVAEQEQRDKIRAKLAALEAK